MVKDVIKNRQSRMLVIIFGILLNKVLYCMYLSERLVHFEIIVVTQTYQYFSACSVSGMRQLQTLKVGFWADSCGAGHEMWVSRRGSWCQSELVMGVMTPNYDECQGLDNCQRGDDMTTGATNREQWEELEHYHGMELYCQDEVTVMTAEARTLMVTLN